MSKKTIKPERLEVANRLRKIREVAGLTQESFAEILGISVSAYKKVESGENQLTVNGLRKLEEEVKVSADYILFGKREGFDSTWKMVQNCSDYDKMFMMLRLLEYFTGLKGEKFLEKNDLKKIDDKILKLLKHRE